MSELHRLKYKFVVKKTENIYFLWWWVSTLNNPKIQQFNNKVFSYFITSSILVVNIIQQSDGNPEG